MMFRGDLLIDGYNLLHAAGFARTSYGRGEFEKARDRLIKLLAQQLNDRERERTTVVFDAPRQSLGPTPPSIRHGIEVIFAGGDGDADAAIERLIRRNSAPKRLHVVSSDHRIQKAAKRRRAKFYDSDAFLTRLARRLTPDERAAVAEPREKQHGLSAAGEIDAWLRAFADVEDIRLSDTLRDQPSSSASSAPTPSTQADDTQVGNASDPPPQRKRRPGATRNEVDFWEQRVAELWDNDSPAQ